MNILICDDDPVFVASLSQKIMRLPDFAPKAMHIKAFSDPDSFQQEDFSACDLLFLDIDMGAINGIDLARQMRKYNPETVLIFVTNFSEYAPEGYEVDAFRFLAKSDIDKKLPGYFSDALTVCRKRQRKVEIFCEGESMPVPVHALSYAESRGHEQCLYMVGWKREELYTRLTMKQLEELLLPQGFLRIHKQYLVNMAYLQTLQSTGAVLTTGKSLPVSARNYRENKQKFVKWQAQQLW